MSSIILILFTGFIGYFIDAILLGLAFAFLLIKSNRKISARVAIPILFLIFAFFDLYYVPPLRSLDITFTIGNNAVAEFLETKPNTSLNEFMSLGLFDFAVWFIQAGFVYLFGHWIREKKC